MSFQGKNASAVRATERCDAADGPQLSFVAHQAEAAARVTASFRVAGRLPELRQGRGPSAGRHAFVTWNYFTADEPSLPAGLLGPVSVVCLAPRAPTP